ncbi:hypothetical protein NKR19_g8912 [Coniochaeta hoffmannii]|uniref:Uncharacterized protein n=1 Tax=Coniochaeta hoffmannii TaxID=91930 RepID=A0AA38VLF1_9PEZI|nr:hypothetical protein NKR19_g8912 [Coniochaeta hoffmannii]
MLPYIEAYLDFPHHSGLPPSASQPTMRHPSSTSSSTASTTATATPSTSPLQTCPATSPSATVSSSSASTSSRGRDIRDICHELRWCARRADETGEDAGAGAARTYRRLARDAALGLVHQYLLAEFATGELGAADRDADKAFETALLVVSPPGTFGWKVRKVGREALRTGLLSA